MLEAVANDNIEEIEVKVVGQIGWLPREALAGHISEALKGE